MDKGFLEIINLILFVFVSLIVVIILLQVKKKWLIKRRLAEYTAILGQATGTRRAFYNVLEETKMALAKLDATKNELADGKARLNDTRAELREKLQEIKQKLKKEERTKVDNHHIAQLKIKFEQHWKLFGSLKKSYCLSRDEYPIMQKDYDELASREKQAFQQWKQDKEAVFRAYHEISKLTKIKHPNEILGKDRAGTLRN